MADEGDKETVLAPEIEKPTETEKPEVEPKADEKPKDHVTLADDEEEIVVGDDDADDGEGGGEDEGGEGDEAERLSRSQRRRQAQKARMQRLERENAELRELMARGQRPAGSADDDDKDLVEPKESDFPNDYLAYERAKQQYDVRKAIRDENRRVADANRKADAERAHIAKLSAYDARLDVVKDRIPDFDDVMKAAQGREIRDDVLDLILDDKKGPLIAYHLAKNPDKVDALNRMSPVAAAREIGSLSARIRGPQSKKATTAPKPKSTPKGGSEPSSSQRELSVEEWFARENKREGVA